MGNYSFVVFRKNRLRHDLIVHIKVTIIRVRLFNLCNIKNPCFLAGTKVQYKYQITIYQITIR